MHFIFMNKCTISSITFSLESFFIHLFIESSIILPSHTY